MKLTEHFNKKFTPDEARLNPAKLYNDVEDFGENEFTRVLETFENHNKTIINYFERRLTNALGIIQCQGKGFQDTVQRREGYQIFHVQTCHAIRLI